MWLQRLEFYRNILLFYDLCPWVQSKKIIAICASYLLTRTRNVLIQWQNLLNREQNLLIREHNLLTCTKCLARNLLTGFTNSLSKLCAQFTKSLAFKLVNCAHKRKWVRRQFTGVCFVKMSSKFYHGQEASKRGGQSKLKFLWRKSFQIQNF